MRLQKCGPLVLTAMYLCACGDDDTAAPPTDTVLDAPFTWERPMVSMDAGPDAPPDAGDPMPAEDDASMPDPVVDPVIDGGDMDQESRTRNPGIRVVGHIKTNVPNIAFINRGQLDLRLVSFHARILTSASFSSVLLWGEVRNFGDVQQCIPLVDVSSFDGWSTTAVMEGAPYRGSSSVSSVCIPPGGFGVIHGIENEVPTDLLDGDVNYSYAITGLPRSEFVPHPLAPQLLVQEVLMGSTGYFVRGRVRASDMPVYNMRLRFLARNADGMIVAEANAFPNDLNTVAPRSIVDFETGFFQFWNGLPEAVFMYPSFIEGTDPTPGQRTAAAPATDPSATDSEEARWAARARAQAQAYEARRAKFEEIFGPQWGGR